MRNREKLQLSAIAVLSLAIISMLIYLPSSQSSDTMQTETISQNLLNEASAVHTTQDAENNTKQYDETYTRIYNQVNDSIVKITSTRTNVNANIIINGIPLDQQTVGLGSGFVYDDSGHIVTNNHVVKDATSVEVTFNSGNSYQAKVIGNDSYNDIAVLEIPDSDNEVIKPLDLADSSFLMVGEPAIAIGNPFGLSNTMTTGIISQTGRLLPTQENGGFSIPNVIQTDAAINPGNSGGPLLDINGQVIGMNTAIQTDTGEFSGIGFAVPSNTISRIVPVLIQKGAYDHPWLGISGVDMTSKITSALELPKNYKGVAIVNVIEDGPAKKAGLHEATYNSKQEIREADIIIAIDGQPVRSMTDIIYHISEKNVDDNVLLTINREGKIIDLYVTLQSRPTLDLS
jgi:S1-C subfamily serine protease